MPQWVFELYIAQSERCDSIHVIPAPSFTDTGCLMYVYTVEQYSLKQSNGIVVTTITDPLSHDGKTLTGARL